MVQRNSDRVPSYGQVEHVHGDDYPAQQQSAFSKGNERYGSCHTDDEYYSDTASLVGGKNKKGGKKGNKKGKKGGCCSCCCKFLLVLLGLLVVFGLVFGALVKWGPMKGSAFVNNDKVSWGDKVAGKYTFVVMWDGKVFKKVDLAAGKCNYVEEFRAMNQKGYFKDLAQEARVAKLREAIISNGLNDDVGGHMEVAFIKEEEIQKIQEHALEFLLNDDVSASSKASKSQFARWIERLHPVNANLDDFDADGKRNPEGIDHRIYREEPPSDERSAFMRAQNELAEMKKRD